MFQADQAHPRPTNLLTMRSLIVAVAVVLAVLCSRAALAQSDADLAGHLRYLEAEKEAEGDPAKMQVLQKRVAAAQQKRDAATAATDALYQANGHVELIREVSKLRIRRSYADLLSLEWGGDFSGEQTRLLKDVKGALFSYTNDAQTDSDSWTAQAAVIWPLIFKTGVTSSGQFCVPLFGLMPSFTVNRFTTNRIPKNAIDAAKIKDLETDEMVFRLGSFAELDFTPNLFAVVRANGRWKTDTGTRSREPGIELEFEPLWQSTQFPSLGLGFLGVPKWAQKAGFNEAPEEYKKHCWFAYQARLRGRFMWGSVEDDGTGKDGPEYARAGVTAELHIEPLIFEKLSMSFSGSYIPALTGNIAQDKYLEAGLGYTIYEEKNGTKISLEGKYIFGAQDNFGKKEQDQYTVALAVLY